MAFQEENSNFRTACLFLSRLFLQIFQILIKIISMLIIVINGIQLELIKLVSADNMLIENYKF